MMASLEDHLRQLEEALLSPETRYDPATLCLLLTEDFCEFGSSGRVFNRQQVVETIQSERLIHYSIADCRVRLLAQNVALVTYKATGRKESEASDTVSLRSSLWVMREGRWLMLFHQGTKIPHPQ
jgi:hypothetical protein